MGDSSDSGADYDVHSSPVLPKTNVKQKPAASRPGGGPDTLTMMIEAIQFNNDPKGASVSYIKEYLVSKHNVDPVYVKHRLRKGLAKGLNSGVLARPKTQAENPTSLSGKIKVVKAELAKQEKAATKKSKISTKPATKESKAKKSPKSKKTETSKKPTTKKVTVKVKATATKKNQTTPKKTAAKKAQIKDKTPTKAKKIADKKAKTPSASRGIKRSPKKTPSKAKARAAKKSAKK